MNTEHYLISVVYRGKSWQLPVEIAHDSILLRIRVNIEGLEVCFARDGHNGLRPLNHQDDFEPELLYLIGKAIQQQRPVQYTDIA